jgi:CRP/FNR family transcriptional regulator, cyclic AMP receptor protein
MNSYTDQGHPPSEYQENLEILRQIPIFSGLPVEALKLLAYLCTREVFKPDEYLFQEGDMDEHAYFILEGKAGLILTFEGASVPIREYGENDFLGGLSLLGPAKRLYSLQAMSRVRCVMFARDQFQRTLEQFPDVAAMVFRETCILIHEWESRLLTEHARQCSDCRGNVGVSLI